jgi:DNA repair exonuclease SbcCD ATPase subunit
LDKLREICPELGLAEIDGKIDDLRAEDPDHQLSNQPVPEAETRLANIEVESQKQKSRLEKLIGQEDAKASELAKQRAGIAQPVVAQLTGLKRQFQEKAAEKEDLQQDTTEKQEALSRKIAETESRLSSERESLRDKQKAKDELAQKYDHARKIWNEAEGRLRQLEKQTDASARKTAEAAIEGAVSESQGSLVEGKPFSKQLALLNDELKAARRVSKNCDKELQMSRGQLELIGGSVIRDQIKRERESLKKLQEDASDFEEQCNAEKYLLDALTGSNDKHSAHLGRMLADPVSSTFNKLTGNRYGTFSLEPTLTVKSVTADGNDRGYELLSAGTRHQLAVLVRLALSAHLQATLLLDDQLVHSDPKRLEWFRETLQESAKQYDHQIIVITCRPSDYGAPFNQNGATSSVDLSDLVERCSLNGNNY